MRSQLLVLVSSAALLPACGGGGESAPSLPQFGDPTTATATEILGPSTGLAQPRDLAWNPRVADQLWVVSRDDDSTLIVENASTDGRTYEKRIDGYALHFMEEVSAIAFGADETTFGAPGTFGTCGESRNTYDGQAEPNDFMGPTLWSSDMSIFAAQNPNGLGSHLDMLHNTPLCLGIAWEGGNRYWTTGGLSGAIERYDFQRDDGIGNDDHSDGLTWRYAPGTIGYVPGVSSHLVVDAGSGYVYANDAAHGRVLRLDAQSGSPSGTENGLETQITMMDGTIIDELVPPGTVERPSGLELVDGTLFVTDHATSLIYAFDLDGNLIDSVDTGLPGGSLAGLTTGPDGLLYFVDSTGDRVFRLDPGAE